MELRNNGLLEKHGVDVLKEKNKDILDEKTEIKEIELTEEINNLV